MLSFIRVIGLKEDHLLRPYLHLALIAQPDVLIPIGEPLAIDLDEVLLAQTPDLPALGLEVVDDECVLAGD
jgi:hypothetical protein